MNVRLSVNLAADVVAALRSRMARERMSATESVRRAPMPHARSHIHKDMTQTLSTPPDSRSRGISAPAGPDHTRVSIARYRNDCQRGKDAYVLDREFTIRVAEIAPGWPKLVQASTAWARRVVSYLVSRGIDQILDISTGLPNPCDEHLHTVARTSGQPPARVIYTDPDPVCAAYGRALLENPADGVHFVQADPSTATVLLGPDRAGQFIDLTRPVGVIMTDVVHHIPDDADPAAIIGHYAAAIAPGSYMAIAHYCQPCDHDARDVARCLESAHRHALGSGYFRSPQQIRSYFRGLELIEPGLVPPAQWRPNGPSAVPDPREADLILAGVAHKSLVGR